MEEKTNVKAVVIGVVLGIAVLAVFITVVLMSLSKRRKRQKDWITSAEKCRRHRQTQKNRFRDYQEESLSTYTGKREWKEWIDRRGCPDPDWKDRGLSGSQG